MMLRNYFYRALILVAPLSVFFCTPVLSSSAPNNAPRATHKPSPRHNKESDIRCTECHQQLKHGGPSGLFNKECMICHESNQPAKLTKTGSAKQQLNKSKINTEGVPFVSSKNPVIDMYYAKSRIGKKTNPMLKVTAGEFTMGTNDRLPDEGPEHKVTLPDFYIDEYEVTNLQYKQFIDATNRRSPKHFRNRTFPEGKADHPVTYVTWYDANQYCAWAGKRLPTEQEWEKAARGNDGRWYPWGNDFDTAKANTPQRWMALEQDGDTTPVGSFKAGVSAYGIYDLSGNVWEWTASWYKPHPGNTRITENYGENYKVLKGGSWWDCTFYKCGISAPSYNRSFFLQSTKNKSFGFRCASDKPVARH